MVTGRPRQRPPQRPSGSRGGRVLDFRPVPSARLLVVYLILATGLVGLAARLAWVQVVQGPQLLNRARAVQTQTIAPIGKRRTIVDRNGRMVALDEERFTVWAHPRFFNLPGDKPDSKRPLAPPRVSGPFWPMRPLHAWCLLERGIPIGAS